MWIWQPNKNPHYQRLMRDVKRKPRDEVELSVLVGVLLGNTANCCVVQGIGSGFYSDELYFYCSGAIVMLVPIFIAIYAAWFTASDTSLPDFDLIRLTNLSGKQITWGYLHALAVRFRFILGFQLGFLIFFLGATAFFLLTTALFYEFPYQQEPPRSDYTQAFMLTVLTIAIGFVDVYWLTSITGILLGIITRHLMNAVFITTGLSALVMITWSLSIDYFLQPFYKPSVSTRFLPSSLLLAIVPFTAIVILLRFAYQFSKHPV